MSVVEELKSVVRSEIDAHLEAKANEQKLLRFLKDQVIQMLIYDQDKISELSNFSDVKLPVSGHEHKSIQIHYRSGARLYISLHTDPSRHDVEEVADLNQEHGCIKCWKKIVVVDAGDNGVRYCGCTPQPPEDCL